MKRAANSFGNGFLALPRGIHLISTRRRILKWAVMPLFLGVAVFMTGLFLGIPFLIHLIPTLASYAIGLLFTSHSLLFSIAYWSVLLLAWPTSLFALFYFLFLISKLIATPFYSLLAESTLIEIGLMKRVPLWQQGWLSASARLLADSAAKTFLFTIAGVLLFFGSFFPGLAPVTAFGFLMIAAFDSVDASFEALQMSLGDRLRFFGREWLAFAGLGAAMGLVFFIPGLNFFLFPAAVVGGADLVRRLRPQNIDMARPAH